MPQVIQLFFDNAAERRIASFMETITEVGLVYDENDEEARPHISLASCPSVDMARVKVGLREIADTSTAFPIAFASVGCFLNEEGAVFLAPAMTAQLMAIQQRASELLTASGSTVGAYYAPGLWVPHCTLAMHLSRNSASEVIRLCMEGITTVSGRVEAIGLVEFGESGSEVHACYPLSTVRQQCDWEPRSTKQQMP